MINGEKLLVEMLHIWSLKIKMLCDKCKDCYKQHIADAAPAVPCDAGPDEDVN